MPIKQYEWVRYVSGQAHREFTEAGQQNKTARRQRQLSMTESATTNRTALPRLRANSKVAGLIALAVTAVPFALLFQPALVDAALYAGGMQCFPQIRVRAAICRLYRSVHYDGAAQLYSYDLVAQAETTLNRESKSGDYPDAAKHAEALAKYIALSRPKSNAESIILYQLSQIDIDAGDYDAAGKVLQHYVNRFGPPEAPDGNPNMYAYALANLGNFLSLRGQAKEALISKLQASQLWERDPVRNAEPLSRVNEEAATLVEDLLQDKKDADELRKAAEHYRALIPVTQK